MRVAFFGAEPKAGTSANMQLAAWGTFFYPFIRDKTGVQKVQFSEVRQKDITGLKQVFPWDLLAVNLSLAGSRWEEFFLIKSFVQTNIIFVIGKYYHSQKRELERFSRWYRIPRERICPIPYNQRFQTAYVSGRVPSYLMWQKREFSYENREFVQSLNGMLMAIGKYGRRKGEIYYG
ncbi:MAG: hypothetical protein K2P76_07040 [Lachnospiraceae bacterium]|nr:hypothetical protein [Lachnospiraceae bacterium]MDE6982201.1 hypothetical protein [Lachnospiraceae bacterium]